MTYEEQLTAAEESIRRSSEFAQKSVMGLLRKECLKQQAEIEDLRKQLGEVAALKERLIKLEHSELAARAKETILQTFIDTQMDEWRKIARKRVSETLDKLADVMDCQPDFVIDRAYELVKYELVLKVIVAAMPNPPTMDKLIDMYAPMIGDRKRWIALHGLHK